MIISEEVLKQVKQKEIGLLRNFIDICNSLHLRHYIAYGTLLGAVRHKGFIPWDDDIDVIMPRSDYEVFLDNAQTMLQDGYFLQTNETDKEYVNPYAKLRDSNTAFLEIPYLNSNINQGIFLDIFPLDYLPDNRLKRKWVLYKNYIHNLRLLLFLNSPNSRHPQIKRLLKYVLRKLYPKTTDALFANLKMCRSIKPSKQMI